MDRFVIYHHVKIDYVNNFISLIDVNIMCYFLMDKNKMSNKMSKIDFHKQEWNLFFVSFINLFFVSF